MHKHSGTIGHPNSEGGLPELAPLPPTSNPQAGLGAQFLVAESDVRSQSWNEDKSNLLQLVISHLLPPLD